jgi:hypothetical protein
MLDEARVMDPEARPEEVRLMACTVVGLGFSYAAFQAGLLREPHMIGCDAEVRTSGRTILARVSIRNRNER